MLIVSKFHDYYDSAHGGFIDKTIIYKRVTEDNETIKLPEFNIPRWAFNSVRDQNYRIIKDQELFFIGFCGKLYPFLFEKDYGCLNNIVWDIDEIVELTHIGSYSSIQKNLNKREENNIRQRKKELKKFLLQTSKLDISNIHLQLNSPIFLINKNSFKPNIKTSNGSFINTYTDKYVIIKDPNLKELEFFKVKNTVECFQNIQTYISNILTNVEKPSNPDNKTKILSHGFDFKWSFRKEKS